jgi:DNA-binding MarR family transcriptional regulator
VPVPRNPFYALFVANQRLRGLLAIAMRDAPIRSDEYGVYSAVFMARSLTPTQLARSTGMPLTTVADYIRTMAERGHLVRRPNPADRRSVLLSLSPAGEETVQAVMPAFTRAVRTVYDELTIANDELVAALEAMAAATERAMERIAAEEGR